MILLLEKKNTTFKSKKKKVNGIYYLSNEFTVGIT